MKEPYFRVEIALQFCLEFIAGKEGVVSIKSDLNRWKIALPNSAQFGAAHFMSYRNFDDERFRVGFDNDVRNEALFYFFNPHAVHANKPPFGHAGLVCNKGAEL